MRVSLAQLLSYTAAFSVLSGAMSFAAPASLSHGPMLGGVTTSFAGVWFRTDTSCDVEVQLLDGRDTLLETAKGRTSESQGLLFTARFHSLAADRSYHYRILLDGQLQFQTNFSTPGSQLADRPVRIVYGSCMNSRRVVKEGPTEFMRMAERNADAVLFLGDFPYTKEGRLQELRQGHQTLRAIPGFRDLTAGRPVYAIWDDHDFGPNDSDGTHPYVTEAFTAFKEHWPSASYGLPDAPGVFGKVSFGEIDFFLLDGRYHSRRVPGQEPTMLGAAQFQWLCDQLKQSRARFKVICSGPQLWRRKGDSWGGEFHRAERDRLLKFIEEQKFTGVLFLSGDVHRSNIHRTRLADGRYIYDFTSSPLAQETRVSPKEADWPPEMIFSHPEENQFCEIEFRPASDRNAALIYRVFSVRKDLVLKFTVLPPELGL